MLFEAARSKLTFVTELYWFEYQSKNRIFKIRLLTRKNYKFIFYRMVLMDWLPISSLEPS